MSSNAPRPQVRDDLVELAGYHSPQVDVDVRLNTNEAPAPPPAEFGRRVAEAAQTLDWHRYPDRGAVELRAALAGLYDLDVGQVFCANGSNEVLQTLLLSYAGAGRRTLTFEPTYALHGHLSRLSGADTVQVERQSDFSIDPQSAVDAVHQHRPAVTFLCSPNNPTGMVDSEETIDAVLDAVTATGGLLVVDEAYGEFAPRSAVDLIDEDRPLVVTKTYSKTWAMAAARLGYALGPSWLVEKLDVVVLPYHLDALKQAAGLIALEFVSEMSARVAEIVEERGRLESHLRDLGCTVWPSGANFVLFRPPLGVVESSGVPGAATVGAAISGAEVWQQLIDRSILVRNTASWDHLDGCLRVTVGTREDNGRFLRAITEILG